MEGRPYLALSVVCSVGKNEALISTPAPLTKIYGGIGLEHHHWEGGDLLIPERHRPARLPESLSP